MAAPAQPIDETVTTGAAAAPRTALAEPARDEGATSALAGQAPSVTTRAGAEPEAVAPVSRARRAPAFEARRRAPIVASTEPAAEAEPAARPKRARLAIRKPRRPAKFAVAHAREPVVVHQRARRLAARDRSRAFGDDGFRAIQARNEAEGFSMVRSRVLPDGRRVTVYRRYDDEGPRRVLAFGGEPRPSFLPFRFLGLD